MFDQVTISWNVRCNASHSGRHRLQQRNRAAFHPPPAKRGEYEDIKVPQEFGDVFSQSNRDDSITQIEMFDLLA